MRPTRKHGVDANQKAIIADLERAKASVVDLSGVGGGLNDLLVGYRKRNYLIEVKDGSKPPSKRKLRPSQVKFRDEWPGQYDIAYNSLDALRIIGAIDCPKPKP